MSKPDPLDIVKELVECRDYMRSMDSAGADRLRMRQLEQLREISSDETELLEKLHFKLSGDLEAYRERRNQIGGVPVTTEDLNVHGK